MDQEGQAGISLSRISVYQNSEIVVENFVLLLLKLKLLSMVRILSVSSFYTWGMLVEDILNLLFF